MNKDPFSRQIISLVNLANELVFRQYGKSLDELEEDVLKGALAGWDYGQIKRQARRDVSVEYLKKCVSPSMRRKVTEALKAIGVLDPELIRLRKNELLILLRQAQERLPPPDPRKDLKETTSKQLQTGTHPQVDWGEAVDVSVFYGRTEELATLEQWIVQDGCRLVVLLGMGGIGKTYLSIKLAEQIQDRFDYVIWRSLRNAPLVQDMLTNLLQLLCNNQEIDFPDDISGKVSLLINYLRSSRCLLVLDNVESILRSGECAGQYREGYEGYGQFFKRVGEAIHQSCLILTSREEPEEISSLQGETRPIRSFRLSGLGEEAKEIFRARNLSGSNDEYKILIDLYQANPFILNIAASTIQEVFNGNIPEFLQQETALFGQINYLLEEQFARLSKLEQEILYWLNINREPALLSDLKQEIVPTVSNRELIDSLSSLRRRSIVEKSTAGFTLQPLVMEYLNKKLIELIYQEIKGNEIKLLNHYSLMLSQAKDYVRESQIRHIFLLIKQKLGTYFKSKIELKNQLLKILTTLREQSPQESGYAAGNILNLLCYLEMDLSGSDFSHLSVWQAYLREVKLPRVNFAYSDLTNCVFAESLGSVLCYQNNPVSRLPSRWSNFS